jgi:hypothetical protein
MMNSSITSWTTWDGNRNSRPAPLVRSRSCAFVIQRGARSADLPLISLQKFHTVFTDRASPASLVPLVASLTRKLKVL